MSERYKFHDPDALYFVTMTIVYWMDIFSRKEFRYIILDSLKYCQQEKGLVIYGWCLMSNHLHLIISCKNGDPSGVVRDFKRFTSRQIVMGFETINESRKGWLMRGFKMAGEKLKRIKDYKVWKDGNHPILLDSNYLLEQRLDYLHENPVEAEIVDEPEDYLYSSARDYVGRKGLLEVVLIE